MATGEILEGVWRHVARHPDWRLVALEPEHVLVAHGPLVLGDGLRALEAALAG
jgi:hypothetical protein